MTEQEARQFVVDHVRVGRQEVAVMKTLLLTHYHDDTTAMLETALRQIGATKPVEVILHSTVESVPTLRQLAEWISWSVAGCEAMWGLVRSGMLIPAATGVDAFHPTISMATFVPGGSGFRSGWDFAEFKISYPHRVTLSRASATSQVFCDPDLFLHELSLPDLHPEVIDAITEAVACFRAELYTAALVMLGKASEGTWIEMGLALLSALPDSDPQKEKLTQEWGGPDVGFAKKMRSIVKLCESKQDQFKSIGAAANMRMDDLRMTMIWSDSLRDARNLVHHNVEANINPTFEMVSTLFLAAMSNLRGLHRLTKAARDSTKPTA